MTSTEGSTKQSVADTAKSWLRKAAGAVIVVGLVIAAYFILAALVPREWAQQVGQWVDGGLTRGSFYGVGIGFASAALAVLLLVFAARHVLRHAALSAVAAVLAIIAAAPNLMTLAVVVGTGNGANAGRRIMDVDAPGFRGGTLAGVIIGVLFAIVWALILAAFRRSRAKKKAAKAAEKQAKEAAKQAEKDAKAAAQARTDTVESGDGAP